jgi:hypothetical protein
MEITMTSVASALAGVGLAGLRENWPKLSKLTDRMLAPLVNVDVDERY